MANKYDFCGWATKSNLKCSDGRVILPNAFEHNDGQVVPLVWNHQHNDPLNVLGHAMLENREDGVYTYGVFNDTDQGQNAKQLVQHGDVVALSIYANRLQQRGDNVVHGSIKEVSLVLAGANPGAYIESVMCHGDNVSDDECVIYSGEELSLYHADCNPDKDKDDPDKQKGTTEKNLEHSKDGEEKTVQDIIDTMNDEQKTVLYGLIGSVVENQNDSKNKEGSEGGDITMKHNAFENDDNNITVLSHSDLQTIIADGKKFGSLRDSFLAHTQDYGIENIDYLFPEAKTVNNQPEFIKRETGWVDKVMGGVHHTPFSRIKSVFANITEDEARAKGYIKGSRKKEEVFGLLKRTTTPQTIYKKQKLDRDDVIDITDFDVVSWLKSEMRMMLDEEIARAILIGDGRSSSDDDKISELNIRPVWKDDDLYTIKRAITVAADSTEDDIAKQFIKDSIRARKGYKGTGNPTLWTTEDMVTSCLLLEDGLGRRLYNSVSDLAIAMRVKEIVTVEVMEGCERVDNEGKTHALLGLIVNLNDYNVGADKGGSVNMFDDFDIDYNQQKYLIETRCSGALIKPYSAIAIEKVYATNSQPAETDDEEELNTQG